MSYAILKDNIKTLITRNKYTATQVEELAGLNKGNISSILSGRSKKPSAELLLSISKVFGVTVEDLFEQKEINFEHLISKEVSLYSDIVMYLKEQIKLNDIKLHYKEFTSIIDEIYEYFSSSQDYNIDKKFINWYLKQKFNL